MALLSAHGLLLRNYLVEIQALGTDNKFRRVSVSRLSKKRNCFRELGKLLEAVSKTFGGAIAITVFPELEEVKDGQGQQAAAGAGEQGTGGAELESDLRNEAASGDAAVLPGISPDPNDPSVAAIPEYPQGVKP